MPHPRLFNTKSLTIKKNTKTYNKNYIDIAKQLNSNFVFVVYWKDTNEHALPINLNRTVSFSNFTFNDKNKAFSFVHKGIKIFRTYKSYSKKERTKKFRNRYQITFKNLKDYAKFKKILTEELNEKNIDYNET